MFARSVPLFRRSPLKSLSNGRISPPRNFQTKPLDTLIKPIPLPSTGSTGSTRGMLGALALSGGAMAYLVAYQDNTYRQEIATPDQLSQQYIKMHSRLLEINYPNSISPAEIARLSDALREAISKSNTKIFGDLIEELIKLNMANDSLYLSMLVNACALQGKTSLLKILVSKLNLTSDINTLIHSNELADTLLKNTASRAIENIAYQFTRGPGKIRYDGAHTLLSYQRDRDKKDTVALLDTPDVTGLDNGYDIRAMLSYLRQQDTRKQFIDAAYDKVVILDVDTLSEGPNSLKVYLDVLKASCDKTDQTITSLFLMFGGHVTVGQISIEKTSDGLYDVRTFYMDSLGIYGSDHPGNFIIDFLEKIFPNQVTYYASEVKVQYANVGCSIFSLMHLYDLIHFSEIFGSDSTLPDSQKKSSLFDYLRENITTTVKAITYDSEGRDIPYTFHQTLPPLAWSRAKQSMNNSGKEITYSSDDPTISYEKTVIGVMGLFGEIENSSTHRKAEYTYPISPYSPKTMEEYLKHVLRENAQGKLQNKATVLEIGTWALQLVRWLSDKSPHDIAQYKDNFSLTTFATKQGIELGNIKELPFDEDRPTLPTEVVAKIKF